MKITKSGQKTEKIEIAWPKNDVKKIDKKACNFMVYLRRQKITLSKCQMKT